MIVQKSIEYLCKTFIQPNVPHWITPNQITLFGGLLGGTAIYMFHQEQYVPACGLFLSYIFADILDGMHARATKQSSKIGSILDHLVDYCVGIQCVFYFTMHNFDINLQQQSLLSYLFVVIFCLPHIQQSITGEFTNTVGCVCGDVELQAFAILMTLLHEYYPALTVSTENSSYLKYLLGSVIGGLLLTNTKIVRSLPLAAYGLMTSLGGTAIYQYVGGTLTLPNTILLNSVPFVTLLWENSIYFNKKKLDFK